MSLETALTEELQARPCDEATWRAFFDWLHESGRDPDAIRYGLLQAPSDQFTASLVHGIAWNAWRIMRCRHPRKIKFDEHGPVPGRPHNATVDLPTAAPTYRCKRKAWVEDVDVYESYSVAKYPKKPRMVALEIVRTECNGEDFSEGELCCDITGLGHRGRLSEARFDSNLNEANTLIYQDNCRLTGAKLEIIRQLRAMHALLTEEGMKARTGEV